jgi:hypothetical protein
MPFYLATVGIVQIAVFLRNSCEKTCKRKRKTRYTNFPLLEFCALVQQRVDIFQRFSAILSIFDHYASTCSYCFCRYDGLHRPYATR